MNKVIIGLAVAVVLVLIAVFALPRYQNYRANSQRETVRIFCESYKPGDLFVENEFNIRAGARGLSPWKSESLKASASATDGEFAAESQIAVGQLRRCYVRAVAGKVTGTRIEDVPH